MVRLMFIEIPDHYATNIGGAMVERAVDVINRTQIVPVYLFQFAYAWDKGLRFDGADVSFWQAVRNSGGDKRLLDRCGLV